MPSSSKSWIWSHSWNIHQLKQLNSRAIIGERIYCNHFNHLWMYTGQVPLTCNQTKAANVSWGFKFNKLLGSSNLIIISMSSWSNVKSFTQSMNQVQAECKLAVFKLESHIHKRDSSGPINPKASILHKFTWSRTLYWLGFKKLDSEFGFRSWASNLHSMESNYLIQNWAA
jgi:hypothetical protein